VLYEGDGVGDGRTVQGEVTLLHSDSVFAINAVSNSSHILCLGSRMYCMPPAYGD
jgi:hypothetical protein